MFRFIFVCIFAFLLCSCAALFTSKYTTANIDAKPLEKYVKCLKEEVSFSPAPVNSILTTNIGETMFVASRYLILQERKIDVSNLRNGFGSNNPFDWTNKYIYDDGSVKALVYTSPSFYSGTIGIIADSNGKFVTEEPFVSIKGSKKGRRWKQNSGVSNSFYSLIEERKVINEWGVRYLGLRNNDLVIEIVPNFAQVSEKNVIQRIYVTKEQFKQGFTLKEIFIKGISINNDGSISYTMKNTKKYLACNNRISDKY